MVEHEKDKRASIYSNVTFWAVISRVFIICLQLISNAIISDHDAGVFVAPTNINETGKLDWMVESLFGGFRRWDAQYFLFIAEHNYAYENSMAFQPLYPLSIRLVTYLLEQVIPSNMLSTRQLSLFAAIAINMFFFAMAAKTLHRLTLHISRSRTKASVATFLFCINPASVFFSAPYTESLYAWLSFQIMCIFDENSINITMPLALSLLCRSNGLVNFGFPLYSTLKKVYQIMSWRNFYTRFKRMAVITVLVLVPYILLQLYNYNMFCKENDISHADYVVNYAAEHNLVLAGKRYDKTVSQWCDEIIPLSYAYVQKTYWNVGLFQYYELKQIPNFLLALPIIWIFLWHIFKYLKKNRQIILKLGFVGDKKIVPEAERLQFPFIVHGLFLTLFCICFVHIQVTTRLLASSSPLLYWFCSDYFLSVAKPRINRRNIGKTLARLTKTVKIILVYFVGYTVVGTVLFSNFLPWT